MRYDITDFEWSVIEPLLPKNRRGVKPRDNRRILNGIFWVLRAGAPWRDFPERYGTYTTAYNRFDRWRCLWFVFDMEGITWHRRTRVFCA
jgi:transposase